MDRRNFLSLDVERDKPLARNPILPRTQSGLNPYTGPWTINEVRHLLRRTTFGATRNDVNYFLGLTCSDAVSELLELINHPAYLAPADPVNNYDSIITDPNCAAGLPWPGTPDSNSPSTYSYRKKSLKSWWIAQMLGQSRSLREKMTLFWSNHFVIELDSVTVSTYVYRYNQLIREFALGNFKQLTREISTNSAMLRYLNGEQNTASAPNENYARELQELFTVGKDASGFPPYTEDDVQAAARVLTGWKNDLVNNNSANGFVSYFEPNRHDTQDKIFSPFYNNQVITGRTGANGALELDDLIDMIFTKDEVALTLCRKLYRWFVYYEIDAATETDVIQPLATIFRNNNYEIVPVLNALFQSEHFFDVLNRGCLIKNPLDFSVGLCRDFNVAFPDSSNLLAQYAAWDKVRQLSAAMQQDLGDPPNVAGFPAYYQEPSYHEMWINSSTLPQRNQFSDRMANTGYTQYTQNFKIDVVAYTETLTNPMDPLVLIEEVLALHYSIDVSQNVRNSLLSILLSGQVSTSYWTTAWSDYMGDPTNTAYYNIVHNRLQTFYVNIMDLSEYQLS